LDTTTRWEKAPVSKLGLDAERQRDGPEARDVRSRFLNKSKSFFLRQKFLRAVAMQKFLHAVAKHTLYPEAKVSPCQAVAMQKLPPEAKEPLGVKEKFLRE
jgi:hypothetical protein